MAKRILICDDANFMRAMLRDILNKAGYEICGEASNGAEGVRMYKELKPDLMTMDVVMPEISGIEAVQKIMEYDSQAKILMCTAMGQQVNVAKAIQAGAKDFVVKPFDPSRVLGAIEKILS